MMASKNCKYNCGKKLVWDNSLPDKVKFVEVDTGIKHSYKRCADLLKEQNKDLSVLDKK